MPTTRRIEFSNPDGVTLAAALVTPDRARPVASVLFAHCFTCGKDIAAASRIARTLAANGFSVLRFDFTGLGGSDGDFANTNFSSNIEDLVAAADWMRSEHEAPSLLVGHSLGGTAVLAAAHRIAECRAVATIAAPADSEHVLRQFASEVGAIEREGERAVSLGGRPFTIRKQFLDDVRAHAEADYIGTLRRALLVFHAPLDATVSVDNATRIFSAAKHPKSFVSLDDADHLLSRLADAQYVADTLTAWVQRYLPALAQERPTVQGGEIRVAEGNHKFLREVYSDDHAWRADEPRRAGGDNLGPDPYEHLLAALGACTSMTLRMYANRKGMSVDDIQVRLRHSREHRSDCEGCEQDGTQIDVIRREIDIAGDLTADERARLMEIANRCPVHRTLTTPTLVEDDPWSADR